MKLSSSGFSSPPQKKKKKPREYISHRTEDEITSSPKIEIEKINGEVMEEEYANKSTHTFLGWRTKTR